MCSHSTTSHACCDCGVELARIRGSRCAARCKKCTRKYRTERQRARIEAQRTPHYCLDCGTALVGNGGWFPLRCPKHIKEQERKKLSGRRYGRHKARVEDIKHNTGCAMCGETFSPALDWHHINPEEKFAPVGQLYNKAWEQVQQEIDKCVLLCATCHRKVHGPLPIA